MKGNKFFEVSYWAYKNGLNSDEFWSMVLSNEEVLLDMLEFIKKLKRGEKNGKCHTTNCRQNK